MRKTMRFWILMVSVLILGCSNDDETSSMIENPFTYDNNTFELKTVWINDFNTDNDLPSRIDISLSNKDEVEIRNSTDIVAIKIGVYDSTINEIIYSELEEYDILIDGETNNGFFNSQNVILTDDYIDSGLELHATDFEFQIIEFNESSIELKFSFSRADGIIIRGEYNGIYIN